VCGVGRVMGGGFVVMGVIWWGSRWWCRSSSLVGTSAMAVSIILCVYPLVVVYW
jgi:hypothetical protein